MKTSIIVPAYNAARFLSQTIESVCAQTAPDWELLIVDDGSTDNTAALACRLAARDTRIRVLCQPNSGASAARNRGLAAARPSSEAIVFLDADDEWEPDTLATLSQALQDRPDALGAYGLARAINTEGALLEPGLLEKHQQERYGIEGGRLTLWPLDRPTTFAVEAVTERIITPGTVLLRRSALRALAEAEALPGPFDPSLPLWEDWDLWLRLTRLGDLHFVNQPVLRYRRHEANLSGQARALDAGARRVRHKLLASVRRDPRRLRIARLGRVSHFRLVAARRLAWARGAALEYRPLAALKQLRHAAHACARSL